VVDRALLATLWVNSLGVVVFVCCLSLDCVDCWPCLGCDPWPPFYSLKGDTGIYMCDWWSSSGEWYCHSPGHVEACPSRPWGMADSMVAPVKGYRALLKSWGSDRWHCCMSYNSWRRLPIVTLDNLPHTSFTVRRYITVKEVRLQWSGWLE